MQVLRGGHDTWDIAQSQPPRVATRTASHGRDVDAERMARALPGLRWIPPAPTMPMGARGPGVRGTRESAREVAPTQTLGVRAHSGSGRVADRSPGGPRRGPQATTHRRTRSV